MAKDKNTKLWLSPIIVIIAIVLAAIVFLFFVPKPNTANTTSSGNGGDSSSISNSVSKFYAEFRQVSPDPIREQFGEDTIILEDQNDAPIDNVIEQVSENTYVPIDNWQGDFKERAFAAQSTLMKEANNHIAKEGFNLVWDLNQDFVVSHRYRSSTTLVGMLEDIAGAVDSNFNQPILVYYCFEKRALVITVRESTYLNVKCEKAANEFQSY